MKEENLKCGIVAQIPRKRIIHAHVHKNLFIENQDKLCVVATTNTTTLTLLEGVVKVD